LAKHLLACLWVGLGGFTGAIARYLVTVLLRRLLGPGFPYGTFFVNVSGSFLLGFLVAALGHQVLPRSSDLRLALGVGFLGAYTTFSTLELECASLLEEGAWGLAAVNVLGSLLLGFCGLRLGLLLGRS
jgi:fluoride exporter